MIDYKHMGYWLGDQASLETLVEAEAQINGRMFDGAEDESHWRLLAVAEGVATLSIKGSLTSKDSPWNAFFGITSYNEIRNAIVAAVEDDDVSSILLDIDSGGGDAKGVSELADFIHEARKHKPIHSYVSGSAFSAAYWIASATESITGPKMSEAGSIGVIAMIPDYSKYYEEKKIKIHVFRGGKYKALGNGYEELTVAAQNIIQGKIDKMEGFFLDAVSENRNIPRSKVKAQVGEGLTFFADEAVENGLMDKVQSFDELYSRLIRSNAQSTGRMTLSEGDMKKVLTEAAVAAKAAGASDEDVAALMEEEQTEAAAAETPEVEAAAAEEAPETVQAEETEAEAAESETEETAEASEDTSLVAYLKDQVAELTKENASLTAKNIEMSGKVETMQANETGLKEIAATFIGQMCVPLGMAAPAAVASMDTANVLAQYSEVRAKFTETFKVGASAEVADDEPESASASELSPVEQAAVAANNI